MTNEKKKTVITGKTVVRFAGILAGIAGTLYLITYLFGIAGKNTGAPDWYIIILTFGACFACLALTRKK